MSVQFGKGGYFEITYAGPWTGLDVQTPETLLDDHASPFTNNFQFRNSELRSRANFALEFMGMDNINPSLGLTSFLDVNAVQHTVGWNARGAWQLAPKGQPPGALYPWAILGGPSLAANIPVSYRAFANILYYCNGGPFLASWDGLTLASTSANAGVAGSTSIAAISKADAPTVISGSVGPLSIGGLYLGELDNHILLANVTVRDEGAGGFVYTFPQRMWWSANGIPTQWDFAANTNAGDNDFLDVPDVLTGLVTLGISGYLFRSSGITFFTPTGNGLAPFQFDHLWASDHGIGNVYPWSIHTYGSICCFVSIEQIYQMGVSSFEPIGGKARDAIMADLALASANPVASIVPTDGLGYVYMSYRISIPLTTFTRHYIYSIEDKSWAVWDTPYLIQTGRCDEVWTGTLSSFATVGVTPPAASAPHPGGGGGGTGGGGTGGCFTGDVRVITLRGAKRFDELLEHVEIINKMGAFTSQLLVHDNYEGTMLMLPSGGMVTLDHLIRDGDAWIPAGEKFPDAKRVDFSGTVYNLHVLTDDEEAKNFILEGHIEAHNNKAHPIL